MSDTELLDVVAVDSDGIVAWVEKEKQRKNAEVLIAELTANPAKGLRYVTAPCGRYAKNDIYRKEDD